MNAAHRTLACGTLMAVALVLPAHAQDNRSGPLTDLSSWIVKTYDEIRERARASDQAEADAAMLREREDAEKAAEFRCRNAPTLKGQYDCIADRSAAFEQLRGRRFDPPSEARFKVLAFMKQRLDAPPAPAPSALPLNPVGMRCNAQPEPYRTNRLLHERACRIGPTAAERQCLQKLDGMIDQSERARRPSAPAPVVRPRQAAAPAQGGKDPSCAIFDDAAKSSELSERDPQGHAALLAACV